jgi:hypothetical protein
MMTSNTEGSFSCSPCKGSVALATAQRIIVVGQTQLEHIPAVVEEHTAVIAVEQARCFHDHCRIPSGF